MPSGIVRGHPWRTHGVLIEYEDGILAVEDTALTTPFREVRAVRRCIRGLHEIPGGDLHLTISRGKTVCAIHAEERWPRLVRFHPGDPDEVLARLQGDPP